jgi:lysozyme
MEISERGITFLEWREGFRERAYRDAAGVWTIGYGTTWINGRPVRPNEVCTKNQAHEWLIEGIIKAEKCIDRSITVPLNQNQFDALVSFIYNIGCGAFRGSTLRETLNSGKEVYDDLFLRWNKITDPLTGGRAPSRGLTARRELEWKLFSDT